VVPLRIPALRERVEDVPLLAEHFLREYWRRHRSRDRPAPELSDAAIDHLQSRPWKGNVRELQNVMEHAIVLVEGRETIGPDDLPQVGGNAAGEFPLQGAYFGEGAAIGGYHETRDRVIARFEKEYLTWVIQESEGNVSEAARVAGVNRATLYRMLERHGLSKGDLMD
jgi:DNA-binding NtrC family response regulator